MRKTHRHRAVPGLDPDSDASRLFRESVGEVRPVRHDRVAPQPSRPPPRPRFSEAEHARVLRDSLSDEFEPVDMETGEELLYARPGIQHSVMSKLRRGQFTVQRELDLHGLRVVEARGAMLEFLYHCRNAGVRCVRIIHGKGRGSHHRQPVLKHKVNLWLQQWDDVLAYSSARQVDGGTGAVYVLLKPRR